MHYCIKVAQHYWYKPEVPWFHASLQLLAYSVVLLLKYRCEDNTFLGFCSDVDGCGHCQAVFPHASLQSCLEVGARVARAMLLIYRLCAMTKRMRSSDLNIFCWTGGRALSETRLSIEEINWRKPPKSQINLSAYLTEYWRWRMLADICSPSPVAVGSRLIFNLSEWQWRTQIKIN